MHLPFRFRFTPAAPAEESAFKLFDTTANLVLAAMASEDSTLRAFGLGWVKAVIDGDEDAFRGSVMSIGVTCDYGCSVSIGGSQATGDSTIVKLWTTHATLGGLAGHAQTFDVGPFIPARPRIVAVSGASANGAIVHEIAGHLEILPCP